MSKRLVIPHPIEITDNQIKQLKDELSHYDVAVKYYADEPTSKEQIIERIKDANYLMIAVLHLNADILSYAKNLEYISITFTGYDHVDIEYCKAHNIKVSNAAGYSIYRKHEGLYKNIYQPGYYYYKTIHQFRKRNASGK